MNEPRGDLPPGVVINLADEREKRKRAKEEESAREKSAQAEAEPELAEAEKERLLEVASRIVATNTPERLAQDYIERTMPYDEGNPARAMVDVYKLASSQLEIDRTFVRDLSFAELLPIVAHYEYKPEGVSASLFLAAAEEMQKRLLGKLGG